MHVGPEQIVWMLRVVRAYVFQRANSVHVGPEQIAWMLRVVRAYVVARFLEKRSIFG